MLRLTVFAFVCVLAVLDLTQGATPCSSGADCAKDECCINNNRPRGKRTVMFHETGHCAPLGTSGSGCLMMYPYSGQPSAMVYECPCQTGLTCQGLGVYDVPLGEMGRCG